MTPVRIATADEGLPIGSGAKNSGQAAMTDTEHLEARLKTLSDAYAAQLPEMLGQIGQAWSRLPLTEWDEEGFQTLHRRVHNLTGSGKTFGYSLLGEVARNLENYLNRLSQTRRAPDEEQRKHIQVLLKELNQVAIDWDASAINPAGWIDLSRPMKSAVCSNRILVMASEPAFAWELSIQLGFFDYDVSVYDNHADFRQALLQEPDVVVLMDIGDSEPDQQALEAMKQIQQASKTLVPVILLAPYDKFSTRLEAVRAGCIAYLRKPVSIVNLVDKLDALTSCQPPSPYRVLIVDDSQALTTYYAAVLTHAGMIAQTVNDPLNVMESLLEFAPDLILIDIYMPKCNGMELARVIRQLDAFVSIPIVFLSAESNLDKQLFAMCLGADDFLTKPIQPLHLISSVSSRIQRSMLLRSFMVRDSLTGLLNHSTIKEQLSREVALAKRQGTALAFAMVDIDHFKQVNDTYGHATGDHVIKSLSRLLKQRLRETEMIGRYGGEEFAVILSNTDAATAARVMDAIRKDFSQLRNMAEDTEFSVTFSCGIADVSHFADHSELCNAADKALYQAKHAGRNRVCLA